MNGRALNDRAIEVSPSSSRVLDRAAGSQPPGGPPLLTPFPPSKNRPRPGDWTCPSCGFSNFQRRTACFRCSFPAIGAGPDPYGSNNYGMQPNPYGGGQGYGHPNMMSGGGHMHGGQYGGMGGMGGSSGRGGIIPFRAGDWKCGNEGCAYHNFAKNVSCLRCGASRNNAAVVAEGGMNNFPGSGYGGPQGPPSMMPPSMNNSSYGGDMSQGGSAYGGGSSMGGGYGGQSFGPPSSYSLPGGLGAPSPYMQGGYGQMSSNGSMQGQGQGQGQGGFDSRAEAAFNQGNASSAGQGGQSGYSNGSSYGQGQYGGGDATDFSFLNSGMNNLGLSDREPRNGQGANTKSPQ
ncbi:Asparagine-rich protein (ARP protein) [Recurvomyces mirabilis]|uniref:Asparagine-rich protein (ARP protein) n=1 Tax=Recurvomyces mirabilis TaxID=574656 RepID=A0AAE0WY47_9PEZI|nr:Asparagine-rich protein (ARP protein) [Recurvomyces mirabilis]KAK5161887.1 Asparagine-rich protein (ARP protein) [Recurvomyces mirabilis]